GEERDERRDDGQADPVPPDRHEVVDLTGLEDFHDCASPSQPTSSVLTLRPRTHQSKTSRVTKTPVKRFATRPTISVTAKPLMGPVPYWRRIKPAMSVVTLPSKMALNALS